MIGNEGAKEIGLALQKNNALTTLVLSTPFYFIPLIIFVVENKIGNVGAKEIGSALQKNNTLTELNLGMSLLYTTTEYNKIDYPGVKEIGRGLQKNNTLTILLLGIFIFLCYCHCKQDTMILVMKGQKKLDSHCRKTMHQLRQISVISTVIIIYRIQQDYWQRSKGSQTLVCLCFATLQFLIGGNKIGDEGAKKIGLALQSNNNWTWIAEERCADCSKIWYTLCFFVYCYQYSQEEIEWGMKEQRKLHLGWKRILHQLHQILVHLLLYTVNSMEWNCI
eukprot:TRINITY_DN1514_c1_g1_i5.p2 TRINITY_DN1514_c1_g1~~TRINITY_DN1514_c1_g1_i5.p2  ORF type:complete len:300 (+),score=-21.43 TRINITY_DN1514_c1_g1_i5:67-900(+)